MTSEEKTRLLDVNNAALDGRGHGLRPVSRVQFAQYIGYMSFYSSFRDAQLAANFLIAHPLGNFLQHDQLAVCRHGLAEPLCQAIRNSRRKIIVTCMDRA